MLSTLSLIAITFISVLWTLPFILLLPFGVPLHRVTIAREVITIRRAVARRASVLVNGTDPLGFFCGWLYFGYIHEVEVANGGKSTEIYLICSHSRYEKLTAGDKPKNPSASLKIWERSGNKFRVTYLPRTIDMGAQEPRAEQTKAIEQIKEVYAARGHVVVLIHGKSGTGKSSTAQLLAKSLSASLCFSFDPTAPSNDLGELCAKTNLSKSSPLVIQLDEADILIKRVRKQTAEICKYSFTLAADKTGWNTRFLDPIDRGAYPGLIIVMTSNRSPEEIIAKCNGDDSYIRPGRVDLRIEL